MTSKPGMNGRLVFGGRNDYQVVPVFGTAGAWGGSFAAMKTGYAARCACELGDHYLTIDPATQVVSERTSNGGAVPDECIFQSVIAASIVIEAWQRQHDAAQRASGETAPQEG